jgi:hypothetical protein
MDRFQFWTRSLQGRPQGVNAPDKLSSPDISIAHKNRSDVAFPLFWQGVRHFVAFFLNCNPTMGELI